MAQEVAGLMHTLTIPARFCGPPASANGGYFAGRVAQLVAGTATVRLLAPPPLEVAFATVTSPDGTLRVMHGEAAVGEARAILERLDLDIPPAPTYGQAVEAADRYAGLRYHRYPGCFVCGTQRRQGDGLRIFAGPLAQSGSTAAGVVASPWVPDETLDAGDGRVRAEFMSAALDCPGYYAVAEHDQAMLLAQFTVDAPRRVRIGERCTVVGWPLGGEGRKRWAGTALFDSNGGLCGRARALWIELRAVSGGAPISA
ncbi:MAG: hypothetical protein JSR67_08985 [Proteobacteria bacterium]|nr:hypothetical protein [Pseudomonadota bacterium]